MHPRVDIAPAAPPPRSIATTGSQPMHSLARTLLKDFVMRLSTPFAFALVACVGSACLGETGNGRKPAPPDDGDPANDVCAKVEKDVVIRTAADMTALPKTGCYDIYGKLTLQGAAVTSLAGLNGLNSVNELELDATGLTAIDTKRPLGIYGRLAVTGNSKLTTLAQLSFETTATGILIDSNSALVTLDPLGLADPKLEQVNGDIAITGNPAVQTIPLKYLTKVTGALTISGNAAVKSIDLSKLTTTGDVDIADNPVLGALTGFAATSISGDLAIRNNAQLSAIGPMAALYRVTGNLTIDNNAALANLAAFTTSLKLIDGALAITNNPALADLGPLKHLQLIGSIMITNNKALISCRADEVNRCVSHLGTAVISQNKDASCSSSCT